MRGEENNEQREDYDVERLSQLEDEAAAGKVMGSNAGVTPPATPQLKKPTLHLSNPNMIMKRLCAIIRRGPTISTQSHLSISNSQQLPTDLDEKKGGMDTSMTTTTTTTTSTIVIMLPLFLV